LTRFDEEVLERVMDSVQAWEMINDPERSGKLTMDGFYRLLRRAGYTEQVAHEAAKQRAWDRLSAGEVM
jgi:hypothetical protein